MAKKQEHVYTSGRVTRGGRGQKRAKAKPKGKSRAPKVVAVALAALLLVGGGVYLFAYTKLGSLLNIGATGTTYDEYYTPKEYQGQVINILVVGVFREDTDAYPEGLGLTDMILYVNYDLQNNRINMLQIPRDSYPGEPVPTGGSGKINAAMVWGADDKNPINNLIGVINKQYGLPVDRYICIDMEGLKEIVDILGPLYVYVPQEMSYDGSYLAQGWQNLDSEATEFFLRNRKGAGFERADIDRLDNQRHFYSALFRRFMNLTARDIVRLMPVFEYRCTTDFAVNDLIDVAFTALKLDSEDIMLCRVPGATRVRDVWEADPTGAGRDVFVTDVRGRGTEEEPGLANLLNTYFRTYGEPVSADQLIAGGMPDVNIPSHVALYPPNVQYMGDVVNSEEGGADVNVEP